jgi:Ala-tRNA(Pro) deacylase
MLAKSLKDYLEQRDVPYTTILHSRGYTAQETAHLAHIPGGLLAKTVMVIIDGAMAMAVVPANRRVRLEDLRHLTGVADVRLAHEDEFRARFPDCELGAMPPFGNLYEMDVYVSPELAAREEITFNAGSHTELIRMAWSDYERLVKPKVAGISASA